VQDALRLGSYDGLFKRDLSIGQDLYVSRDLYVTGAIHGVADYAVVSGTSSGLVSGVSVTNLLVNDATETNGAVNLSQLRSFSAGGNITAYFTETKILDAPYTNGLTGLETNQLYLLDSVSGCGTQATRTIPSVAIGSYYCAAIDTNRTYTDFSHTRIFVDRFLSENSAGSAYVKAEVYRVETVAPYTWIEWGQGAASNLVLASATPASSEWNVPTTSVNTNVAWWLGYKLKRVAGSSSPNLISGSGTNYPSMISFVAPLSALQNVAYASVANIASNLTPALTAVVRNASSLTNWPTQFTSYHSNSVSGSNAILLANGNFQRFILTGTTTNFLPARTQTAFEFVELQMDIGAQTFVFNTNIVTIGTNYLGQGSWPVFRTNEQSFSCVGYPGVGYWRVFPK
jgi:hypothetical protein